MGANRNARDRWINAEEGTVMAELWPPQTIVSLLDVK